MRKYWKVHISEFDNFVDYILVRFECLDINPKEFINFYGSSDYICMYITDENNNMNGYKYILTYTVGNRSRPWIDEWEYMGEYNLRKRIGRYK